MREGGREGSVSVSVVRQYRINHQSQYITMTSFGKVPW